MPLEIYTEAIINSTLDPVHDVTSKVENSNENVSDNIKSFLVFTQVPLPKPSSPNSNEILPLIDSDDSVDDPHWTPLSRKKKVHQLPSSYDEDEVQLALRTSDTSYREENVPLYTDDEIEHQLGAMQRNKKLILCM